MRALTHNDEIDRLVTLHPVFGLPADYGHNGSDCDDARCSQDCRWYEDEQ
jgi:hypothetical protein